MLHHNYIHCLECILYTHCLAYSLLQIFFIPGQPVAQRLAYKPPTRMNPKVSRLSHNEINNNTCSEAIQRIMVTKLTRLTHKIVIQLHLVAESHTICSSHSRWPVWKLLDTPLYLKGTRFHPNHFF